MTNSHGGFLHAWHVFVRDYSNLWDGSKKDELDAEKLWTDAADYAEEAAKGRNERIVLLVNKTMTGPARSPSKPAADGPDDSPQCLTLRRNCPSADAATSWTSAR